METVPLNELLLLFYDMSFKLKKPPGLQKGERR